MMWVRAETSYAHFFWEAQTTLRCTPVYCFLFGQAIMAGIATIMNESLSPTRANPKNPISPSNYPDKRSVVAAYKRMVRWQTNCTSYEP